MRRFIYGLALITALVGCDENGDMDGGTDSDASVPDVDGGGGGTDAGPGVDGGGGGTDAGGGADAGMVGGGAATSTQIQTALDAPDGSAAIQIDDAVVTYVKPAVGDDVAGFFVQAEAIGPALFVAVDPATLTPSPAVGSVVSFEIRQMATVESRREANMIQGFTESSNGHSVAFLVQDLTTTDDVLTNLDDYESELVRVTALLVFGWEATGAGHDSNAIDTAGVAGSFDYRIRVPSELHFELDLTEGCSVLITGPMWRIGARALPSAYSASDLEVVDCPEPAVVGAAATSATEVRVRLSRRIDMASITTPATQFTITDSGGAALAVSAATAVSDGRAVTLTTAAQTPLEEYTVVVASTVTDLEGQGVDDTMNSATFGGFTDTPGLELREVNSRIASGCDLMEFRVTRPGNLMDYSLYYNVTRVLTFPSMDVALDDLVVVHFNSSTLSCRGGVTPVPTGETAAEDEVPAATVSTNFDGAFDHYALTSAGHPGINSFVVTVYDRTGAGPDATDPLTGMVEAAAFTHSSMDPVDSGTSVMVCQTALDAEQWQSPVVGGATYTADNYFESAISGLDATGNAASGDSLQLSGADADSPTGWAVAAQTWGVLN